MIEENFIMLLVAGALLAMLLMSLATRVGECSLLGYVLLGFGIPIGLQAYLSNVLWIQYLTTPFWILSLALIMSDWFERYEWIEILLGVPKEKRWRADNQGSNQKVKTHG